MEILGEQETKSIKETRICDLSDDLLEEILSRNSMDKAVATSILSSRWKKVWTTLLNLNFDISSDPKEDFLSLIDKTLARYIGKSMCIPRFTLTLDKCNYKLTQYVNELAQKLTVCNIKELILCQKTLCNSYFPAKILMVKSITVLRLTGCNLESFMADKIKLVSLRNLSLDSVVVNDMLIKKILDTSLDLEELSIENCKGITNLRVANLLRLSVIRLDTNQGLKMICIDASTLEHFFHKGVPCAIWFKNCSNLRTLVMCHVKDEKLIYRLAPLNNLKYLKLHFWEEIKFSRSLTTLELSYCEDLSKADNDTPNLQFLKLSGDKIISISLKTPSKLKVELDFRDVARMGLKEFVDLLNLLRELNEPMRVTLIINVQEKEIIPEEWIMHFMDIENLTCYKNLWLGRNIRILDGIRMIFPGHNIQFEKPLLSDSSIIISSVWVEVKKKNKVPVSSKKKALHFNPTLPFESNELRQEISNLVIPFQNDISNPVIIPSRNDRSKPVISSQNDSSKVGSNDNVTLTNKFQCLYCNDYSLIDL